MSFEDKSLQCSDCGATFVFSADDQEFFQSKGYTNEPKRCPECREGLAKLQVGNRILLVSEIYETQEQVERFYTLLTQP